MCKANVYKERPFAPKFSYTLTFLYFKVTIQRMP